MSSKSQYKTKQGDELLTFLETVSGQHVTVAEICAYFREKGKAIGTTTVYRHLERLVKDGYVKKYVIDGNSPACFEYIGGEHHTDGEVCYHCKCEICGRLIHLHCDELPQVEAHVKMHHGFTINPVRTIFYGVCEACTAKDK